MDTGRKILTRPAMAPRSFPRKDGATLLDSLLDDRRHQEIGTVKKLILHRKERGVVWVMKEERTLGGEAMFFRLVAQMAP